MSEKNVGLLTIDEYNRLFDGMLVAELGVEQRSADKGAIVGGLVPAHMQMVNVDVTQRTHHLHLVLDYRHRERHRWRERVGQGSE